MMQNPVLWDEIRARIIRLAQFQSSNPKGYEGKKAQLFVMLACCFFQQLWGRTLSLPFPHICPLYPLNHQKTKQQSLLAMTHVGTWARAAANCQSNMFLWSLWTTDSHFARTSVDCQWLCKLNAWKFFITLTTLHTLVLLDAFTCIILMTRTCNFFHCRRMLLCREWLLCSAPHANLNVVELALKGEFLCTRLTSHQSFGLDCFYWCKLCCNWRQCIISQIQNVANPKCGNCKQVFMQLWVAECKHKHWSWWPSWISSLLVNQISGCAGITSKTGHAWHLQIGWLVLANQIPPFSPSPTLNLIHERDLRCTDTATLISS